MKKKTAMMKKEEPRFENAGDVPCSGLSADETRALMVKAHNAVIEALKPLIMADTGGNKPNPCMVAERGFAAENGALAALVEFWLANELLKPKQVRVLLNAAVEHLVGAAEEHRPAVEGALGFRDEDANLPLGADAEE